MHFYQFKLCKTEPGSLCAITKNSTQLVYWFTSKWLLVSGNWQSWKKVENVHKRYFDDQKCPKTFYDKSA